jgi:hypothetical protein
MVSAAHLNEYLFPISLESALKHLVDVDNFYIICPNPEPLQEAYGARFGDRVKWVNEKDFNITKPWVREIMIETIRQMKPDYELDGKSPIETQIKVPWYLQQCLKLNAGEYLGLDDYVVIDSDLIWYKDIHFKAVGIDESADLDLFDDYPVHPGERASHRAKNRYTNDLLKILPRHSPLDPDIQKTIPRYNFAHSTQYHVSYFAVMDKLIGARPIAKIHHSGIVHHMTFVKEVVQDLTRHVHKRMGLGLCQAMINQSAIELLAHWPGNRNKLASAGSVLSEFEIYFHYARMVWPETMRRRPLLWANGPSVGRRFWPKNDSFYNNPKKSWKIPVDSVMNSPAWLVLVRDGVKNEHPMQQKADAISGYDFVGYHSYAKRRYYEMHVHETEKLACSHLPQGIFPEKNTIGWPEKNTTCSWSGFEKSNKTLAYNKFSDTDDERAKLWFRDCICYQFRHRM